MASLDHHLREKDAAFSIAKDIEFSNSRKVLEGKARLLRQKDFRKRPNAAKALTSQDEELLWSKEVLGSHSSQSLIQTMWFLLTQHFSLRGCQEHHDFAFSTDDNGIEFVKPPLISSIISAECAMAQSSRVRQRLERLDVVNTDVANTFLMNDERSTTVNHFHGCQVTINYNIASKLGNADQQE